MPSRRELLATAESHMQRLTRFSSEIQHEHRLSRAERKTIQKTSLALGAYLRSFGGAGGFVHYMGSFWYGRSVKRKGAPKPHRDLDVGVFGIQGKRRTDQAPFPLPHDLKVFHRGTPLEIDLWGYPHESLVDPAHPHEAARNLVFLHMGRMLNPTRLRRELLKSYVDAIRLRVRSYSASELEDFNHSLAHSLRNMARVRAGKRKLPFY